MCGSPTESRPSSFNGTIAARTKFDLDVNTGSLIRSISMLRGGDVVAYTGTDIDEDFAAVRSHDQPLLAAAPSVSDSSPAVSSCR